MIHTREEMKRYALSVCVPMLELAAERRLSGEACEVVDTVGYIPTQLEEAFRPFWGIAPILKEENVHLNIRGQQVPIGQWLRQVLVTGTDPESEYYWDSDRVAVGEYMFDFQNLTEIAGLLVGCFFAKEQTWDCMTPQEQRQVADYIGTRCQSQCAHVAGNNHIWFPLFCLLVLRKFGFEYEGTDRFLAEGLEKLDTMYVGGGWYSDGLFGRIDYYEAWSMHSYPLLWCLIEDESCPGYARRRALYLRRTEEFLQDYVKFFDADGAHPPFGRSLAYRFAASCVFPLAVLAGANVDPALAGEITCRNVTYFANASHVAPNGILTPGYLYNAPGLIDNYTSSGGPYWAAKTFLCLMLPEEHPFWRGAALPIEGEAYIEKPKDARLNFAFAGDLASGVTVYNNHFQYYQDGRYYNPFNDMAAYYNKFCYNSRSGFAVSTRDNTAGDNMISLFTREGSMTSHRWGFTDLGADGDAMVSCHAPFANDPDTTITTWLLPLQGSLHVRVHRVRLSREYGIREGGFSLGIWDDFRAREQAGDTYSIRDRKHVSVLKAMGTVKFAYSEKKLQPGLHLLAPFGVYPAYETEILPAGEYVFASVFGVFDLERVPRLPEIALHDHAVTVNFDGRKQVIRL